MFKRRRINWEKVDWLSIVAGVILVLALITFPIYGPLLSSTSWHDDGPYDRVYGGR